MQAGSQTLAATNAGNAALVFDAKIDGPCTKFTVTNTDSAETVYASAEPLHGGQFFPIPPLTSQDFDYSFKLGGIRSVRIYASAAGVVAYVGKAALVIDQQAK